METIPIEIFAIIAMSTDVTTGGILAQVSKLFNQYIKKDIIWETLILILYQKINNREMINLIDMYTKYNSWYDVAHYIVIL